MGSSLAGPLGGPPPAPSWCAMGARCWVGVPSLPSPHRWPLVLGARERLGGGALRRLSVGPFLLRILSPGGFVPPLLLLWPSVSCGPMSVILRCRPRNGWASYRRRRRLFSVLTTLARVAFSCGFSSAGGVCGQVPCAAGSLRRLRLRVFPLRHASLRCAISAIGR